MMNSMEKRLGAQMKEKMEVAREMKSYLQMLSKIAIMPLAYSGEIDKLVNRAEEVGL